MNLVRKSFEFLGSFGLACIILLLLMVLTFFGTIDQVHLSLFEVRQKYFESNLVFVSSMNIPLPGGFVVLSLLFVNLIVGGMLRMRWSWSRLGILVIHFGIALMLVGSLIEFRTSKKGALRLTEGQSGAQFQSYDEWEVVITEPLEGGRSREYIVGHDRIRRLQGSKTTRFSADGLPFDVVLSGFLHNCQPVPSGDPSLGVDGYLLQELPRDKENSERDIAGISARVEGAPEGTQAGLLWGFQQEQWPVLSGGRAYALGIRKRTWPLPFTVHLRDFTHEVHPGTEVASRYSSDVTCVQNNVSQDVHISMNEPLRRDGFILFQSGYFGDRTSIFAVVENPADQLPLISLVIIALGLLINFLPKLWKHVARNHAARSAAVAVPTT